MKPIGQFEPDTDWVSKVEIAKRFGITVRTVERWMKCGFLPYVKIDRLVYFYLSDVDEALKRKFGQNYKAGL